MQLVLRRHFNMELRIPCRSLSSNSFATKHISTTNERLPHSPSCSKAMSKLAEITIQTSSLLLEVATNFSFKSRQKNVI